VHSPKDLFHPAGFSNKKEKEDIKDDSQDVGGQSSSDCSWINNFGVDVVAFSPKKAENDLLSRIL
jgi:hypothetical protein